MEQRKRFYQPEDCPTCGNELDYYKDGKFYYCPVCKDSNAPPTDIPPESIKWTKLNPEDTCVKIKYKKGKNYIIDENN